jgi:acyl carrier protein
VSVEKSWAVSVLTCCAVKIGGVGIDALDLVFRLEKAFDFKMPRREAASLYWSAEQIRSKAPRPNDATIGQIHERLCEILKRQGRAVPVDSWQRVQRTVSECLFIPIDQVRAESRFVQDLDAS